MTYDDRKMCIGYANMVNIADGIQHIYRTGAYELLSPEAKRRLTDAEANIQSVMGEMYKYVSSNTESGKGKKKNKKEERA